MPSWCLVHVTPGLSPSVGQRVLWVEHRFWHRGPSWSSLVRLIFGWVWNAGPVWGAVPDTLLGPEGSDLPAL